MSIFIDNSFTPVCQNLEVLNETGIVSFVKKFYTGKDKAEIDEFKEELKKAKNASRLKYLIDDIEESIEDVDDFLHNSTLARFFGHGLIGAAVAPGSGVFAGLSAVAVNLWFKNGKAKRSLLIHRDELEKIKKDAIQKLNQLK